MLRINEKTLPLLATIVVCLLLYVFGSVAYYQNNFFSSAVLDQLFARKCELGIVAVGMTFVILAGGIDLSVGSVMALSTMVVAMLVVKVHVHPIVAMSVALGVGAAFGLLNGCLIQVFDLPPFLVTLATLFLGRGLALVVNHQRPIPLDAVHFFSNPNPDAASFTTLGITIGGVTIPIRAIVFVLVVIIGAVIARTTRFGRNVYALGGNEQASSLMGLPVARTKIIVYAMSGLLSALAGIVWLSGVSSGDPLMGLGWELDAIAAVVIGGTLLTGGVGSVVGTLLGVLILALIEQLINSDGRLDPSWARIVNGLLLFAFIALQKLLTVFRPGRQKAMAGSLLASVRRAPKTI
jgi:galactofuranose transport system permease protein